MVRLRAQMVLFGDSMADLAEYLNISRQTLSSRMNGHTQFKQKEIMSIASRYKLDSDMILKIFF